MDYIQDTSLSEQYHIVHCQEVRDNFYFPVSRPLDHTMGKCLDEWVKQKIPFSILEECVLSGTKIEVHGIFPDCFSPLGTSLGYVILQEIPFNTHAPNKKFNYIRPRFYFCEKPTGDIVFVAAVTPGKDYIFHYAGLLRHGLSLLTRDYEDSLSLHRYPVYEKKLPAWSGLDKKFIQKGDIVILGYVEEIETRLAKTLGRRKFEYLSRNQNSFYTTTRYKIKEKRINFLGVKYSFWGCMSGIIAEKICELGGQEILYVGKLGCFSSPQHVYDRIFSPTKYSILRYVGIEENVSIENPVVKIIPELDSGLHVSVPSVIEEDINQGKVARLMGAQSIDNEISKIAFAVVSYNMEHNKQVRFASLHFASDYLTINPGRGYVSQYNLSNNRTPKAKALKESMLDKIANYLVEYFRK